VSATTHPPLTPKQSRKVAVASFVGTALESYDQYVYLWLAALLVGPLFFEPLGALGGTFAAFATVGVTWLARPLGALIFGHFGDRFGRRSTLIATITLMGIATGAIGLLPTYEQAGWLGGAILVFLRLLQGLSLGGEWGGAVTLAAEYSSARNRPFYTTFPQLGSPVGTILSGLAWITILNVVPFDELADSIWWRIPLLSAFPLLLVALWVRYSIDETPIFKDMKSAGKEAKVPLLLLLKPKILVLIAIATGTAVLGHGSYTLMNLYTRNYGVIDLGYNPMTFEWAVIIGSLVQLIAIPLFGALAMRVGSARIVAFGALGTLIVSFPLYWIILDRSELALVAIMVVGGILPTAAWAALGGAMSDMFSEKVRYTALALSYNLAAGLASILPLILLSMKVATDNAWWHPGVVLAGLSAITLFSALAAARISSKFSEPQYARQG